MEKDATAKWLIKIATALETWHTMPPDDVGVAMTVTTPFGAVMYILNRQIPAAERAAVLAAVPAVLTEDFAEAARRVRQAAEGR